MRERKLMDKMKEGFLCKGTPQQESEGKREPNRGCFESMEPLPTITSRKVPNVLEQLRIVVSDPFPIRCMFAEHLEREGDPIEGESKPKFTFNLPRLTPEEAWNLVMTLNIFQVAIWQAFGGGMDEYQSCCMPDLPSPSDAQYVESDGDPEF